MLSDRFGLEVPKQLRWHKWHALEESVKLLCVKNVCTKVTDAVQGVTGLSGVQDIDHDSR